MTAHEIRMTALDGADLVNATGLSAALGWPYRLEDWAFAHALGEGLGLRLGDRLIGTGMRWTYGTAFATVGMIIVDAEFRGKGLGARLVDGLLDSVGERSVILNATTEGLELYRRRGFTSVGLTCQHQGIAKPTPAPDDAYCIEPPRDADWPAMIALDEAGAGMPRSHLLQALAHGGTARVLRGKNGAVEGYAVCREFGRGHVIGPVIAANTQAATALIGQAMVALAGQFVRINAPAQSGLGKWLEDHGLDMVNTEEAMVRGTLPRASAQARIFALCSNSLG